MNRTAQQIIAELDEARARVAALEAELDAAAAAAPTSAQRQAASSLVTTTETVAPTTKYGPTANRAADKAVITRKFNAALKVWGGDYAGLRAFTLAMIEERGSEYAVARSYLLRNQFSA